MWCGVGGVCGRNFGGGGGGGGGCGGVGCGSGVVVVVAGVVTTFAMVEYYLYIISQW